MVTSSWIRPWIARNISEHRGTLISLLPHRIKHKSLILLTYMYILVCLIHRYGERGRDRPPGYGRDDGQQTQRPTREEQIKNLSEQLKSLETKYKVSHYK